MSRDLTKTAKALHEIPISEMVKSTAMGLIEAQYELDRNTIQLAMQMGDPANGVKLGGVTRSLLELGFTPHMYQFSKVEISLKIDITVRESEEYGIKGAISLGNAGPATSST